MDIGFSLMTDLPAVVMLIIGFVLVVVEMYIPGFGLPGILGVLLLVGGIVIARPTPLQALIMALIIVVLLCVALFISIRTAAKGRFAKSRLVLKAVAVRTGAKDAENAAELVGAEGTTHTVLRPAGIAELGGAKYNVVSDGEFIPAETKVVVERVEGNRIFVRRAV